MTKNDSVSAPEIEANPEMKNESKPNEQMISLHQEIDSLKAKLLSTEKQRDEYLVLAKQARAEFENYQKRFQRDLTIERQFAQKPLALDLLAPIDSLERAIAAGQAAGDKDTLVQGVSMVQSLLVDTLRRHGVTPIQAIGKPFDPNLHQAVMQQPTADFTEPTVLQVLEQGYMIFDRVLRPARVIVSCSNKPS